MTEPLTPPDCDLRDWPSMLLDVVRLRDSSLASDEEPEACWAAVLLWAASWHQVPAASIPDDDRWIAKHAGYAQRGKIDTKAWSRVRDGALRHFVVCSDGRRYHRVVAEKALECWLESRARALSSGAGNAKRWKTEFDPKPIEAQILVARAMLSALNPNSKALHKRKTSGAPIQSEEHPAGTPDAHPDVIPPGSQEKGSEGKGTSSDLRSGAAAASPPVDKSTDQKPEPRVAWRNCGNWMVENGVSEEVARALMGKVIADYPAVALEAIAAAPTKGATPDPKAYLVATAQRLAGSRNTVPSDDAEKTKAYLAEQAAHSARVEAERLARLAVRAAEGQPS